MRQSPCVCGSTITVEDGEAVWSVLQVHYAGSVHTSWSLRNRDWPTDVTPHHNPYDVKSECAWPGCPTQTPRRYCYFHVKSLAMAEAAA